MDFQHQSRYRQDHGNKLLCIKKITELWKASNDLDHPFKIQKTASVINLISTRSHSSGAIVEIGSKNCSQIGKLPLRAMVSGPGTGHLLVLKWLNHFSQLKRKSKHLSKLYLFSSNFLLHIKIFTQFIFTVWTTL